MNLHKYPSLLITETRGYYNKMTFSNAINDLLIVTRTEVRKYDSLGIFHTK